MELAELLPIIVLLLIGTGAGGGLVGSYIRREKIRQEAERAVQMASQEVFDRMSALNKRLDDRNNWLHDQVKQQDLLIEQLQQTLSDTRAQLAEAQRELANLKADNQVMRIRITQLEDDKVRLEGKLTYERRRRRELEKTVRAGGESCDDGA